MLTHIQAEEGGYNFEKRINTLLAIAMLTGNFIPFLEGRYITKLKFQTKNLGYATDDTAIYSEDSSNKENITLIEIKNKITISKKNPIFQKIINDAWKDFSCGKKNIAVITSSLNSDAKDFFNWVKTSNGIEDFKEKIEFRKNCSSNKKIELYEYI